MVEVNTVEKNNLVFAKKESCGLSSVCIDLNSLGAKGVWILHLSLYQSQAIFSPFVWDPSNLKSENYIQLELQLIRNKAVRLNYDVANDAAKHVSVCATVLVCNTRFRLHVLLYENEYDLLSNFSIDKV